jgi:hypothetical protein
MGLRAVHEHASAARPVCMRSEWCPMGFHTLRVCLNADRENVVTSTHTSTPEESPALHPRLESAQSVSSAHVQVYMMPSSCAVITPDSLRNGSRRHLKTRVVRSMPHCEDATTPQAVTFVVCIDPSESPLTNPMGCHATWPMPAALGIVKNAPPRMARARGTWARIEGEELAFRPVRLPC